MSSEPSGPPLHPAYFETLFRTWTDPSTFPEEFVIVTAFAPTGETWTRERNLESHERLRIALEAEQDLWFAEIEGYAPDGDHAELGFGIGLPLKAGQLLGRSFGQDAIYHVHVDGLSVASCEEGAGIIPVGRFRERLRFVRHR